MTATIHHARRPLPSHALLGGNFRAWAVATCTAEVSHREADFYRAAREIGHTFDRFTDPNCMLAGQFPHEGFAGAALSWLSHLQTHDSDRRGTWPRLDWAKASRAEKVEWLQRRRYLVHGFLRQVARYREARQAVDAPMAVAAE